MAKVIEFLRLLDKDDLVLGAVKLFSLSFALVALTIFIALAVSAWKVTLGVCS